VTESRADLEEVVKVQAERIRFLEAENARLRRRVASLENALTGRVREAEKRYRELEPYFNRLEKVLLKTAVHASRVKRGQVHKDEILRAFRARHPWLKVKNETVERLLRKLREKGMLHSPEPGYYVPCVAATAT